MNTAERLGRNQVEQRAAPQIPLRHEGCQLRLPSLAPQLASGAHFQQAHGRIARHVLQVRIHGGTRLTHQVAHKQDLFPPRAGWRKEGMVA